MPHQPSLAHVGIAVRSIEEAIPFYQVVLGLSAGSTQESDGARIASLPMGETEIELLEPDHPDSPIAKFLAKRGPGIHHLCFRVPDLAQALTACRAAGYELVDSVPREGAGGHRIAFIHPKSTAGILLELTE